ncbi:alpha/beta hydrolase fold domain-containing protein [Fructilactobacillus frigidiflavus]|uniref:alpha/beta hydrolase fold domain-containing protein n=1 Tax=Fructilactobacillus frigidiflavus TaxID=3242688 RepID=UPI003757BBAC
MVKFIERHPTFVPADTTGIERQFLDLPYASGQRHKLDLYLPNQHQASYPVIIDVHGGGMYFGQKSSNKLNGALELLKRGYAVVSPNYSLSQMALFPHPVYELKAVIRWVRAHAQQYHLDNENIFLMGESSGAQLAMLVAASESSQQLQSDFGGNLAYSSQVNGVIASYGPYDLAMMPAQFAVLGQTPKFAETGAADSFEGMMLGNQRPSDVPALNAAVNPQTYLTEQMVPVLMYAGKQDWVVPYLQTINLAAEVAQKIGSEHVELQLSADAPHGPSGFMNETVFAQKEQFLQRNLH